MVFTADLLHRGGKAVVIILDCAGIHDLYSAGVGTPNNNGIPGARFSAHLTVLYILGKTVLKLIEQNFVAAGMFEVCDGHREQCVSVSF